MGSEVVGDLRVSMGLDTRPWEADLKRTKAQARGFGLDIKKGLSAGLQEIEVGFRSSASQAGILGTALSGMGLAGVAAGATLAAVGAAAAKAREAFSFADDIGDTATKLAVSSKALQEYRYAVHQLGGEYSDADEALQGFTEAFGAAKAKMSAKAVKPFEQLFGKGFEPKTLGDTETALKAVIDKISNLSDTAEQAAIAKKLGLTPMLSTIRAGVPEMERLRKKAEEIGFVMDDALVEKGGQANDQMEDMGKILQVQVNSALIELAPVILQVGQAFVDAARGVRSLISDVGDLINRVKSSAFGEMLAKIKQLWDRGGGWSPVDLIPGGLFIRQGMEGAEADRKRISDKADFTPVTTSQILGKFGPPSAKGGGELNIIPTGGAAKKDKSAEQLAKATLDEMRARQALTDDIELQAQIREKEIDAATAEANRAVTADAQVNAATKRKIIALNNQSADEQKAKVQKDLERQRDEQNLDYQESIGRIIGDRMHIEADAAGTAAQRAAIEARILQDDQRQELLRKQFDLEHNANLTEQERAAELDEFKRKQAAQRAQLAQQNQAKILEEQNSRAKDALDLQVDILSGQADLAPSTYARVKVEEQILALQQDEERHHLEQVVSLGKLAGYTDQEVESAKNRLAALPQLFAQQHDQLHVGETLIDSYSNLASAIDGMTDAFSKGDIAGGLNSLAQSLKEASGLFGGKSSGLGSMLASLSTTASGFAAFGSIAKAITGSTFGLVGKLLKPKPSNHGAGAAIGADGQVILSGSKRNDETTQAATEAATAIQKGQAALQKLGATLNSTVNGLTIGTRDATEIVLSTGEKLSSAVGDVGAAEETALRAVLKGATFADTAQKKLVDGMLASGESVDTILQALQDAADAAIQKAEEIAAKRRSLEIDLLNAGGDTAGALAAQRSDDLAAMDETLRGFQKAVWTAQDASDQVAQWKDTVDKARDAEISQLQQAVDKYQQIADALRDFRDQLDADTFGQTSAQTLAKARAAFDDTAAKAAANDNDAQSALVGVGQAFVEASKSGAKTAVDARRDMAKVRTAVENTEEVALSQVELAQSQIDATNRTTDAVLGVKSAVIGLQAAMAGLASAMQSQSAALSAAQAIQANGGFDAATYLADNPDIAAAYQDYASGSSAYSDFYASGLTEDQFAKAHYDNTGKGEIANGLRKFANGGSFRVGGFGGTDSQLVQFMASPNERVTIQTPAQQGGGFDTAVMMAIVRNTGEVAKVLRRWDGDGQPDVRDEAA